MGIYVIQKGDSSGRGQETNSSVFRTGLFQIQSYRMNLREDTPWTFANMNNTTRLCGVPTHFLLSSWHQECCFRQNPTTLEETRSVSMGETIGLAAGWALTTSPATSNSKTSSVSFPVKTEENTPTSLLKNNQSDLKDSIDYRLST